LKNTGREREIKMDVNGKVINILGTDYKIRVEDSAQNCKLKNANGLCEIYSKEIVIDPIEEDPDCYENLEAYRRRVVRHELVHAFFAESGLRTESKYAENEELVDWIAIQLPKIVRACESLGVMEE
jgi:hypothetical protein